MLHATAMRANVARLLINLLLWGLVVPGIQAQSPGANQPTKTPRGVSKEIQFIDGLTQSQITSQPRSAITAERLADTTGAPQPGKIATLNGTVSVLRSASEATPVSGIQHNLAAKSAMRRLAIQPPRSPFEQIAHFPASYLPPGATVPAQASKRAKRLRIHPNELRFGLTKAGPLPTDQWLDLIAEGTSTTSFEIVSLPGWLEASRDRGRASAAATAVRISLIAQRVDSPVEGEIVVRAGEDPTEELRIPVRVELLEANDRKLLESRGEHGRLERAVRSDGGVVDYDYDERGQLIRIRYPDHSSVQYSYDDNGLRTGMLDGRGKTLYRYDQEGRLSAVDHPGIGAVRYGYDDQGKLAWIQHPDGKVVGYGYDGDGRLSSVRDDTGVFTYGYDPATGRLREHRRPDGGTTEYRYNQGGRLAEVVHRDPWAELVLGFRYVFDEHDRLIRVGRQLANGTDWTDYGYDEHDRLIRVDGSDGRSLSFAYDDLGRRVRQTVSEGARLTVTDFAYESGRLVRAGDEDFHYDVNGNLAARISPRREVRYGYDFEDRLAWVDDGEKLVRYEYDGDGRRVGRIVDGQRTRYVHDLSGFIGEVIFETGPTGRLERSYTHGLERLGFDQDGDRRRFLYDPWSSNVAALDDGQGAVVAFFDYDPFGTLRAPTAEPGTRNRQLQYRYGGESFDPDTGLIDLAGLDYDPGLGRWLNPRPSSAQGLTRPRPPHISRGLFGDQRLQALGPAPVASETPDEEPVEESQGPGSDADGPPTTPTRVFSFQSNSLPPKSLATPQYNARQYNARKALKLSQLLRSTSYQRPVLERGLQPVVLKPHPETLTFAQSASGLQPTEQTLEVFSSTGEVLAFTAAASAPWLSISTTSGTAGSDPAVLTLSVDSSGLGSGDSPYNGEILLAQTDDPSQERRVSVRLTVSDSETRSELRSFDLDNRLQRLVKTDGSIVDYFYDASGRIVRIRYPDGEEVNFTYDANDNRTQMVDSRGTTVYQYDTKNRLRAIFHPGLQPIRYDYDSADNLTQMTYPGGEVVRYAYDTDSRLVSVDSAEGNTSYDYDSTHGLLVRQTLPNGVVTTYAYDTEGRLALVEHRNGASELIASYQLGLDASGRRTSILKTTPTGTETSLFTYNDVGLLASATYPNGREETYTYNEVGKRTSVEVRQGAQVEMIDYEYDGGDRLVRAGDVAFQYDGAGNLIRRLASDQVIEYDYDARNQLIRFDDGQTEVVYRYDGDGRRVGDIRNGIERRRINGVNGELLVEADVRGMPLRTYHYGIDQIDVSSAGQTDFLLDQGPFSSTPIVTGGGGEVTSVCEFDVFGNPLAADCDSDSHLFSGLPVDTDTGLVEVEVGDFDPETGEFINGEEPPGPGQDNQGSTQTTTVTPSSGANTGSPAPNNAQTSPLPLSNSVATAGSSSQAQGTGSTTGTGVNGAIGAAAGFDLKQLFINGLLSGLQPVFDAATSIIDAAASVVRGLGAAVGSFATDVIGSLARGLGRVLGANFPGSFGSDLAAAGRGFLGAIGGIFTGLFDALKSIIGGLGGVDLNKTADLLLEIDQIAGVTFDEATGQLVIFGEEDISLPSINLTDMAIAVDSVFMDQDPGVSIDLPIQNGQMPVRYEGQTAQTEFGWIMFEADRVLKILTLGKDNITGQPVGSSVPGYRNMLSRYLAAGCNASSTNRMFFQPKEVRLVRSADGQTMLFEEVSMELISESMVGDQIVNDPQATAFAAHFTDNYDLFAEEWPILKELERLAKIVAVIKWIKDNDIPIDLSFLDNHEIEFFSTPQTTPAVTTSGTVGLCTITITGGVTYRPPNEYLEDDPVNPVTDAVRDEVLGGRPSEADFLWTFESSAGGLATRATGPMMAVAQSFTRSRKAGNTRFSETDLSYPAAGDVRLELVRYYDSFADRTGPLGRGWSVLPAEIRFPVAERTFSFGPDNQLIDLHDRLWVAERGEDREDLFQLVGIDADDLPVYLRSGASDLLRRLADGSYLLTRTDHGQRSFAADGRLLRLSDANGNAVDYGYDGQDRLVSLQASGNGQTIALTYDGQDLLASATGPGPQTVTYGYDTDGNLSRVTDSAGRTRDFAYDTDGILSSVVGAAGQPVLGASYDDYGRTPSRRVGSAADFAFDYDLAARRTEITDPFGERVRQLFDDQYRLLEQTDALGNRLQVAYDGDFGPAEIVDAQGNLSQRAYDSRGNLVTTIGPEGERTELYYDFRDRLVAIREPEGPERGFGYDDSDNLTAIYRTVILNFDDDGNLVSFAYAIDDVVELAYDANGELATIIDPSGNATELSRNTAGQVEMATTATGLSTELVYDERARVSERGVGAVRTTFTYDDADNVTVVNTGLSETRFEYDLNGNVTKLTDPRGQVTRFTYDADGNRIGIEDPALRATTLGYDSLGRLTAARLADGTEQRFEYDALGRQVVSITELASSSPRLGLVTEALDFGRVAVGGIASRQLEIYNLSRAPLTLIGVTAPTPFATDATGSIVVPAAESRIVTVSFAPTGLGPATANLTVSSDDPSQLVRLVSLSGEGVVQVTGLQATGSANGIALAWDAFDPGSEPFEHFNIYRNQQPIAGDVSGLVPIDESLTDATTTEFLDSTAAPGTSYYYAVTAVLTTLPENTEVTPVGPVAFFTSFGVVGEELTLANSAAGETRPTLAFSPTAGEYVLVYESDVGGQLDLLGQRASSDGTLLGTPFTVAGTAVDERKPRLVYNPTQNDYMVVFETDFNGDGSNSVIFGQRISTTGSLLGASFLVGGFSIDEVDPEIAFNSNANEYLAVFSLDGNGDGKIDVVGQRLTATGQTASTAFFVGNVLANGTPIDDHTAHLAYNPNADEFFAVFEVDTLDNGSAFDIFGIRVVGGGSTTLGLTRIGSTATVDGPLTDRDAFVRYDNTHDQYLVTWEADLAGDGSHFSIFSQKVDNVGSGDGLISDGFFGIAHPAGSARRPRQIYNPGTDEFLIVWEEEDAAAWRLMGRRYQLTASSLVLGGNLEISSGADSRQRPDLARNPTTNDFLVAWQQGAVEGASDLHGRLLGNATAVLEVGVAALDFGDAATSQVLALNNTGSGVLDWLIVSDEAWLSVEPSSGSTEGTSQATVSVDRSALPAGPYSGLLSITSNGGNAEIPVTMTVANSPPDAPHDPLPATGAIDLMAPDGSLDLLLGWQAEDSDGDALTFDLYLDTDAAAVDALDPSVRQAQGLDEPSASLTGLAYATLYHWRVVAFDGPGGDTPGPSWTFTTVAIPAPRLNVLEPDPTADPRPILSWQTVVGASAYQVQVASDATFLDPLYDTSGVATRFTPPTDLPAGEIHWRVRSMDANGQLGPFSEADRFILDLTPPGTVTLVPVTPERIGDPRPTLAWSSVVEAVAYRLQIATTMAFESPIVDLVLSASAYEPQADLPEGAIFWRVASRDEVGNESPFSPADTFVVDLTPPVQVGGLQVERTPTGAELTWEALPATPDFDFFNVYRAEQSFDNVSALAPLASGLIDVSATEFTDATAVAGTTYFYALTAVDLASNENRDVMAVELPANLPPAIPSTPLPLDGATEVDGPDPTMQWQASDPDSTSLVFDLYLSTDPSQIDSQDLTARVAQELPTASFAATGLRFETTYHWRVVTFDDLGASTIGPAWRFTTASMDAPVLENTIADPTNDPRPTFQWQSVQDAATYNLVIDDDADFASPAIDETALSGLVFTPLVDLPEGRLYWRVRALAADGQQGPFSAAASFVLDLTPPASPDLTPVGPDPTLDPRPALAWTLVPDAVIYRLQVASEATFASLLHDVEVTEGSWIPTADLPEGEVHWRVASRDQAGNGSPFSTSDNFVIDRTPIAPITGLHSTWTGLETWELRWNAFDEAPADLLGFAVYRQDEVFDNIVGLTPLASLNDPDAVTYTDPTAVLGTDYYYAVVAVDQAGNTFPDVTPILAPGEAPLFANGFESGDTSAWSATVP